MVGVAGIESATNGLKGKASTIDDKGLTRQHQSNQTVTVRWWIVMVGW
jgi:hypothetical protein